jgi:hypothetical protein
MAGHRLPRSDAAEAAAVLDRLVTLAVIFAPTVTI